MFFFRDGNLLSKYNDHDKSLAAFKKFIKRMKGEGKKKNSKTTKKAEL